MRLLKAAISTRSRGAGRKGTDSVQLQDIFYHAATPSNLQKQHKPITSQTRGLQGKLERYRGHIIEDSKVQYADLTEAGRKLG